MTAFRISLRGAPRRCGLALLLLTAAVPPAAAQSTGDRLERIEREIGALQRYVYSGGGGAGGGSGDAADPAYRERVEVRINSLEGEMRDLTGRIEELNHSVRRLQDRLDKLVQDVDFRLTAMERAAQGGGTQGGGTQGGGAAPSATPRASATEPPPPVTSTPPRTGGAPSSTPSEPSRTAALPTGSAMELYDHARQLLSQTRYDEAEAAFREFLQRHPNNALTENARYWLGETYYVRKRYDDAAAAFLEGYQKHPKGSKAADNLLKLGLSLSALQKGPEACVALEKLVREYPNADSYILRRAEQERGQLRCG